MRGAAEGRQDDRATQSVRVAPFRAQNMSDNARAVDGGEIGVAQYLQALAAGTEPDVRMNPILVKPEGMTRSQVVVLGGADEAPARFLGGSGARTCGRVSRALCDR